MHCQCHRRWTLVELRQSGNEADHACMRYELKQTGGLVQLAEGGGRQRKRTESHASADTLRLGFLPRLPSLSRELVVRMALGSLQHLVLLLRHLGGANLLLFSLSTGRREIKGKILLQIIQEKKTSPSLSMFTHAKEHCLMVTFKGEVHSDAASHHL